MQETFSLSDFQADLLDQIRDSMYPPGRRVQLALASLWIVHDHHRAITALLEKNIHASAFALSRPLYEALLKGLWLSYCAPEHKLEAFATGRELDSVSALTEDLLAAQLPPVVLDSVRNIKQRYWKGLCSFAHAGHAQLKRWLSPDGVEPPHYTEAEIKELMNFTAFMVLVATLEMANLSNNGSAVVALEELLPVDTWQ